MKNFYLFLITIFATSLGFGQTTIFNEAGGGTAPAGWTFENNVTSNDIDRGSYWLVEDGPTNDFIITDTYDLSSYGSATFTLDVATFGSGTNNSAKIEISDDGGSTYTQVEVSNTPSSSSYIDGGTFSLNSLTSQVVIRISSNGTTGKDVRLRNLELVAVGGSPITSVEFTSASASVSEGVGTTDLTFSITNPDGTNATSFDVELTTGDNADINGYTTQTVTFPAGSSADETVTITVTDDATFEGNETLIFTITGVTGGNNATLGTQSTFDLTIEDNESSPGFAFWHEPFNNSDLYTVTAGGEGNDGTQDYFEITDGSNINQSYTNIDGTFHASQDIDDGGWTNSATPSQLTWTGIDVSEFTTLSFKGSFASNGGGIDDTDFVLVEYQIDSGGWMNLLAFENTGGFNNNFLEDTNFDGTGDGLQLSGTFQEFEKSLPVGSSLDLRITVSINSGGEDLAFDNFKVYGIYNGYAYSDGSWYPANPDATTGASNAIVADGVAVLSSDVNLNDVVVNPGAGLEVETGNTLAVNSLTLESSSTSYSSLILDGSITGSVSYKRYVNAYTNDAVNNDNDLISAPVTGQAFGSFDSANTNLLASGSVRAFAPFNNNTDVYENYDATTNAATTLDAATGYRAATTDGATLTFTGTVNTGDVLKDITIGTGASYAEWNLIGNPYPSYIDVEAFLTHVVSTQTSGERNIDLLDALSGIYGYDGDASDGWDIITLANDAGRYLAPGQGFFVAASGNGTLIADHDIEFTAAMRTTGTSDDFIAGRNNDPLTFIELKAFTANNDYSTEFYFDADASQGLDPGYDAVIWGGSAPSFALYSHLVQDNTGLPIALQALSDTDYNNVIIPLGVNANMSEQLTFSIVENTLPASIEVYLDDTLTSTSTLLNASDYVLTPSEDLNGTGRFYLRFSNSALSITNAIFEGVSIYTHQSNKTVTIAGQLTEGTSANVYDIQGRLVASKTLASNTTLQTIDVSNLNTGVYIVKLANGNTVKTQKIILK
ncbi:T9SS type A sorting domain-containing protein [Winogradskyella poriferorum]|uniref:T9SS type A sorting domain-containing protein n=1 Tax=Winogradskyella poriferorum TaxID=307627 RepID=UPI003D649E01